jgi:hypothetical protein
MGMRHALAKSMNGSIFTRELADPHPPGPYERIEPEVRHLASRGKSSWSVRPKYAVARLLLGATAAILVGLYVLDPFVMAVHKARAMRSYLFLSQYGNAKVVSELVESPVLTDYEVRMLKGRTGQFLDYYVNTTQAEEASRQAIAYVEGIDRLHRHDLSEADLFGKIRYHLFIRWGLIPPRQWRTLNPDPRTLG